MRLSSLILLIHTTIKAHSMVEQIYQKKMPRKCLYYTAKNNKSLEAWESYQRLRNRITKEIEIAHADYQSCLFTDDSNNSFKHLWRYIKSLHKDHIGVLTLIKMARL